VFGAPLSESQWRLINAFAAVLLALAAALALGWVIAVGCVMHALIDEITRLLSIGGALHMEFPPFWVAGSVDRHVSDLQGIFFNEPWLLIEGLLWGALCWVALTSARARRWWLASALTAVAALTVIGLLRRTGYCTRTSASVVMDTVCSR
jgi:hypothetical protein